MPTKTKKIQTGDNAAYGLALTILLIVLALFIGGLCAIWRESIVQQAQQRSESRVETLEKRIRLLEATLTSSTHEIGPAKTVTTTTQSGSDERDIYNAVTLTSIIGCQEPLNTDQATSTVVYSNTDQGLASIQLPYNASWGTKIHGIDPYEPAGVPQNLILFGPLVKQSSPGDCTILRSMSLEFVAPASASSAMKNMISFNRQETNPILRKITNDLQYIKPSNYQNLDHFYIEVLGTKSNIRLSSESADNLSELERIARTIKFTP